jgi:hypothetical protein
MPYSPECVELEFSEVAPSPKSCYIGCERSGGERGERRKTLGTVMNSIRNGLGMRET